MNPQTEDELQKFTMDLGEVLTRHIQADEAECGYILIVGKRIQGQLCTALTSNNTKPGLITHILQDIVDGMTEQPEDVKLLKRPKEQ